MEMHSGPSHSMQSRSAVFCSTGQTPRIVENCGNTIILNDNLALDYYNKGLGHYQRGSLEHALADFTAAVRLNSSFEQAFNARGCIYAQLGQDDLALRDFDKSISLAPETSLSYANRATILYKREHYYGALQDLNHDIAISGSGESYLKRAAVLNVIKMYEQAVKDCSIALDSSRELIFAFLIRGQALLALKEFRQSVEDLTRYLEVDSGNAIAYWLRSHAYSFLYQEELAQADYYRAIQINPALASLALAN